MQSLAVRVAARHTRMAANPVGKQVYLNRDQATHFGFPYYGGEGYRAIVAADIPGQVDAGVAALPPYAATATLADATAAWAAVPAR